MYNNKTMMSTKSKFTTKVAFIDSANTTIQVPESIYNHIVTEMRHADKSIGTRIMLDGAEIIVAHKACSLLYDKLADLKFRI